MKLLPIWTKSNFSAFLLNSRHFEFQISPTLDKTPSLFLQKRFFYWKMFQKKFFDGMGGKRVRACAGPTGPAPPFRRKKSLKRFSMKKSFLQRVKEFYSESGWFEIRNVWDSAKKQKSLILFKLEAVSNVIWEWFFMLFEVCKENKNLVF